MPTYQLISAKTGAVIQTIGEYPSLEAVHKLTVFKMKPHLKQYIQEVTVTKPVKRSNRWRVIHSIGTCDMYGPYTAEEAWEQAINFPHPVKLIKVPKYAYHESDGVIPKQEN